MRLGTKCGDTAQDQGLFVELKKKKLVAFIYLCAFMHAMVAMGRSEDKLPELALFPPCGSWGI